MKKKTLALTITLLLGASGIAMADHPNTNETDEPLSICTTSLAFLAPVLGHDCGPRLLGPPLEQPKDRDDHDRKGDRDQHPTRPPVESAPSDG